MFNKITLYIEYLLYALPFLTLFFYTLSRPAFSSDTFSVPFSYTLSQLAVSSDLHSQLLFSRRYLNRPFHRTYILSSFFLDVISTGRFIGLPFSVPFFYV